VDDTYNLPSDRPQRRPRVTRPHHPRLVSPLEAERIVASLLDEAQEISRPFAAPHNGAVSTTPRQRT